jgi:hypothetical protein
MAAGGIAFGVSEANEALARQRERVESWRTRATAITSVAGVVAGLLARTRNHDGWWLATMLVLGAVVLTGLLILLSWSLVWQPNDFGLIARLSDFPEDKASRLLVALKGQAYEVNDRAQVRRVRRLWWIHVAAGTLAVVLAVVYLGWS